MRAGIAKSEITTSEPGAAVHDPLYAKALVLEDDETLAVIIAMDALAIGGIGDIGNDFLAKLRERLEQELAIPAGNVLVNASHTHPPGRLLCSDAEQVDRTFDAVRRALSNRVEVRTGSGTGYEDRVSINRNLRLKDGSYWTIRYAHPCPPDAEVTGVGPIDPEIGIIRIDRLDGSPLAVIYNFACHPLIGVPDKSITANYPGFASNVIEEYLGEDAMAFFLQGAGGDLIEEQYKDVNRSRDAEPIGTMLGLSTVRAIKKVVTSHQSLHVIRESIQFPRRTDIPDRMQALLREQAELLDSLRGICLNFKTFVPLYIKYGLHPEFPAGYSYDYLQAKEIGSNKVVQMDIENRRNLQRYMNNIAAMERLATIGVNLETLKHHQALNDANDGAVIETEVMGIKIGECVLITAPAEVLVEVGLNVKKASPYKHTFMAAYTNGFYDYAPLASDYDKGGYEVVECHLAPEWQSIYEAKALDIIRKL